MFDGSPLDRTAFDLASLFDLAPLLVVLMLGRALFGCSLVRGTLLRISLRSSTLLGLSALLCRKLLCRKLLCRTMLCGPLLPGALLRRPPLSLGPLLRGPARVLRPGRRSLAFGIDIALRGGTLLGVALLLGPMLRRALRRRTLLQCAPLFFGALRGGSLPLGTTRRLRADLRRVALGLLLLDLLLDCLRLRRSRLQSSLLRSP